MLTNFLVEIKSLSNSPLSFNKEYSKFSKLLKSCVSKPKAKCFAAIGIKESVSLTLTNVIYFLFYPNFLFQKYILLQFLGIVFRLLAYV